MKSYNMDGGVLDSNIMCDARVYSWVWFYEIKYASFNFSGIEPITNSRVIKVTR